MWRQTVVQKYTFYDKYTVFASIFVKSGDSKAFFDTFATIVATERKWLDTAVLDGLLGCEKQASTYTSVFIFSFDFCSIQ